MRPQSGFLLVEILIALVIFTSLALIFARYQWNVYCLLDDANAHACAVTSLRNDLETIMIEQRLPAAITKPYTFSIKQISLKDKFRTSHSMKMNCLDGINMIEVTVKWKSILDTSQSVSMIAIHEGSPWRKLKTTVFH